LRISDWRWVSPVTAAPRAKDRPWCGGSGVRSTRENRGCRP